MSSYEIRVFIIGDYQVGKKSIVNRFKKLISTQTEEDSKRKKSKVKKKSKSKEKVVPYEQLDDSEKMAIRKEKERQKLMKFKKIYIVGHKRLEFNFFPIISAEEKDVSPVGDYREESEDLRVGNTLLNFKKPINEIKGIITKDAKDPNSNLEYLFLFVYDLKNFSSFKKMEIYFNQLNYYFQLDSNYLKAFLANKQDAKIPLRKKEKETFENFIKKNNNIKLYELSTFNYFNFENFFEQLFKGVIISMDEELQDPIFLNRFHLILHSRSNLSKAKRNIHSINDIPFLSETDNPDVYAYPEKKEDFRRTFSNIRKGRYTYKIFIDKKGPIFPIVDKQVNEKNKGGDKSMYDFYKDKRSKTLIGFSNWKTAERNKEIQESLKINIPGYSLGILGGRYGLRNERKKIFQERDEQLQSAFDEENAGITRKKFYDRSRRQINHVLNKKEAMRGIVEKIKENEERHLEERERNKKHNEELMLQKIKEVKLKQEKYEKIYEKNKKKAKKKMEELNHPKTAIQRGNRAKSKVDMPVYTLYDVRTKYDPNKGWSMGMKFTYNPNKNKDDPDFPKFKTDFDRIVESPKYAQIKYTAPRFKEEKIIKPSEDIPINDDNEYFNKIKKIKEKGERMANLKLFLEERKMKSEKVKENKKKLEEDKRDEIEELKERLNPNDYDHNVQDINYKLVEESSPNYTMKGRYNHGTIFDTHENYSVIINDEDEDNKLGSNGKQIQDEEYIKSLPIPQYNIIKPTMPSFSFNKAKRFFNKPLYQPSPNATPEMIFKNGKFKPDEQKTFSKGNGGMGKAEKNTKLKFNGMPGPAQYKIKGFADKIVEEGYKVSIVREKIKKEKDAEMKKKNEKIENEKNNGEVKKKKEKNPKELELSDFSKHDEDDD